MMGSLESRITAMKYFLGYEEGMPLPLLLTLVDHAASGR